MTWDAFHRRGEVLRTVLEQADVRRDGVLPMEVPGVAETFGDEVALLGALQLRWHTRLAGSIEHVLMDQPMDLEAAVVRAWRSAANELAGVRAILDRYSDSPTSEEMAQMLAVAQRKDWALLAAMAGKAAPADRLAADVGRRIEERARATFRYSVHTHGRSSSSGRRRAEHKDTLLHRLKAHLAA